MWHRFTQVVIETTIKNEGGSLAEWLEYHLRVGIEHFYLYDNNSNDGTRRVLQPYIDRGLVTLVVWPFLSPIRTRTQQKGHFVLVKCFPTVVL